MKRLSSMAALAGFILGMFAGARMAHAGEVMHHMALTALRPERAGDRVRADAILAAARAAMQRWPDVVSVEAAGFAKFAPGLALPIEHYTNEAYAREAWTGDLNPDHPTSMIFERHAGSLTLVGVMYTVGPSTSEQRLDTIVPLSVARWHRHVNFCLPASGAPGDGRFGIGGSIESRDECARAHGRWLPQLFGWMVHVWPGEHDEKSIWAVDRRDAHGHASMAM